MTHPSDAHARQTPPMFVVTGSAPATRRQVSASLAEIKAVGWTIIRGWAAPMARDHVVCTGVVATADDARRALLSAIGGAGLVVSARVDPDTLNRFLDDLRRLGPVNHLALNGHRVDLNVQQRALLTRLGEGLSVAEAAAELGLTRSTADRRLAAARRELGVRSNAEAVVAAIAHVR